MADILDRIAGDRQRQLNSEVATAEHDANWANTFNSIPSAEKLRANLNFADTVDRALTNKLALAARGDVKALDLLHKTAQHQEWQRQAPLREELLTRKVESEGAHEAFVQRKDAEAMADVAGFLKSIGSLTAKPGTPEYQQGLNDALQSHPRVIGTQVGADALKRLQQEHEDISAITPPPGKRVGKMTQGSDGKWHAEFVDIPAEVVIQPGMAPVVQTVKNPDGSTTRYEAPKTTGGKEAAKNVPSGILGRYDTALGQVSYLQEAAKNANGANLAEIQAKLTGHEEVVRSLESQYPTLRATRGLEEKPAAAAPKQESPEQIVARIKASGGTKEDAVKALRDAGHKY